MLLTTIPTKGIIRLTRILALAVGLAVVSGLALFTLERLGTAEVDRLQGHAYGVVALAFTEDGTGLLSAGRDRTLRLWHAAGGQLLREFDYSQASPTNAAVAHDASGIIASYEGGLVRVLSAINGKELSRFATGGYACAIARRAPRVLALSLDSELTLWDVRGGSQIWTIARSGLRSMTSVAISEDATLGATGNLNGTVSLWNLETTAEAELFFGHVGWVECVAFSADAKRLLSGGSDTTVNVWNLETGRRVHRLRGHTANVLAVAFSPDAKRALSGSADGTVRLWNLITGQEIKVLRGHRDWVYCVAFSPDGRFAVSGGGAARGTSLALRTPDNSIRVWKLPSVVDSE